jgi:predicted metal-dependent HD superfamily phosphohydrolase
MSLKDRWLRFWSSARAEGDPSGPWKELSAHYGEPHRAYHTLQHIEHCLEEFEPARHEAHDKIAVEFAIWYHDAVYDTHRRDNEERSALLAEQMASAAGLDPALARHAGNLIRISTHRKPATDPDARLFADVDLSILGQPPDVFAEYEEHVRQEYAWVPEEQFRSLRAQILETFLDRFSIYMTDPFREKYEKQARANLTHSLLVLRGGSG